MKKPLFISPESALSMICMSLTLWCAGSVEASILVPQTALPGDCIPQFSVPLPVFGPAGPIPRIDASKHKNLQITMKETDQAVLPVGGTDTCGLGVTFGKTRIWGYEIADGHSKKVLAPANWPAVTVEAKRHVTTDITYVNKLPTFNPLDPTGAGLIQGLLSVDPTIHWADPFHPANEENPCMDNPFAVGCTQPFTGAPPAVVHLHGGEVPSMYDGGPGSWFTPDGKTGPTYSTLHKTPSGTAVYRYPNDQEAGTLWFHDHALGMTRTNVYSGMEAFYLLRDPSREPKNLPKNAYEIELAIQDRQFDINSQLFFPDGSGLDAATSNLNGTPANPDIHPSWLPEFIGDVAVVNGAPWPYFNVEPRRYRLRLLNGSNARFYNLDFGGIPIFAMGADDNYINSAAPIQKVFIAPGERLDVIADFTGSAGRSITVTNDAPTPYPSGLVPGSDQPGMANIMQFRVVTPLSGVDDSCDPALGDCKRTKPMVRLTDGNGHLATGVKIDRVRQLVLKEHESSTTQAPLEVMLNNTEWNGEESPSVKTDFAKTDGVTELPRRGATELWEIINLTGDAHPIHIHLTQFQILNRETYNDDPDSGYSAAWEAAFPAATSFDPTCTGGVFCPGYGPPRPYGSPNDDGALGGNPAISPYLMHDMEPPAPEESGWKDTAKAMPQQVLRLVVRWTPTDVAVKPNKSYAGHNLYSFDPTKGPGYVWHCHILDHEDNEMMRPYAVQR